MKRFLIVILLLAGLIPGAAAQDSGTELIANGGLALGWESWTTNTPCTDCSLNIAADYLPDGSAFVWNRINSGGNGSAIWVYQDINADVSPYTALTLSLDVWVDQQSLPNSGWWSDENNGPGEYPAVVSIIFADTAGTEFAWTHGFLVTHDGSTLLTNYTLLPEASQRTHWEADILDPQLWNDGHGGPLPTPVRLLRFSIGGSGWDFAGGAAHLSLTGSAGGSTTAGFTVEEYPLVSADQDTPTHFEFRDRVTQDMLALREGWRAPDPAVQIEAINVTIGQAGYKLVDKPDQQGDMVEMVYALLYHESVLIPDVSHVWPIAVSASGQDFALLLETMSTPTLIVTPETVGQLGMEFIYVAPVFVGEDLYAVEGNWETNTFTVSRSGEVIYT
ncbi:MAG: hypothetical protein EHM39_12580, partial [Chloroflexi bacterium]